MKFKLLAFSGGHGIRRMRMGFGRGFGGGVNRGLAMSGAGMGPGVLHQSILPQVTALEEDFFELVTLGDIDKLEQFLQGAYKFDVNCKNYQGYTGLVLAVKLDDVAMVEYLLQYSDLEMGEALLHAARGGNTTIVQLLIDHESFRHAKELGVGGAVDSPEFDSAMTPLMVAAHFDHYAVIHLLLERGQRIEKPHPPHCFCSEKCYKKILGETLHESKLRLNQYKAIASSAYICQTSEDPILTAFLLSHELELCGRVERELQEEYERLSNQVSEFAVSLLDECRTTDEVTTILSRRTKSMKSMVRATTQLARFSRLALAMDYDQKSFVAHPNCQHVLRSTWLEGWQDWRTLSVPRKFLTLGPRIVFLPIIALMYLVFPSQAWGTSWRCPLNKFINFSASYLLFLVLLFAQNSMDFYDNTRGPPSTGLEWPIALYMLGLTWLNFKVYWKRGLHHYCRQEWALYDMMMIVFFMGAFLCWIAASYDVSVHQNRMLPRHFWHQYDPTLVGEAFYSFAFIMAYGKLLYFLQMANQLGPMQISMSRMVSDVINFLLVFLLTMLAFSVGLVQLYHHYTGQVQRVDGQEKSMSTSFSSLRSAYSTLYWAIYGYSPPAFADVVLKEHYINAHNKTVTVLNHHTMTEVVGHFLFGTYYVVGIIIMVNMLIAMMSTSFSIVQENASLEWKFARTKVWLSYFDSGATLPPPFNLIPSPKLVLQLFSWIVHYYKGDHKAGYSCAKCCYFKEEDREEAEGSDYLLLMGQLVQRYLTAQVRQRDFIPATMSDMEPLHHQLKDLRIEIKHLKRTLCPKTPQPHNDTLHPSASTLQHTH